MTDLDTLLHDYAATRNAEVEPITTDEILSLAATRSLDDSSDAPDVGAGVRSRRWLAIAAVVALLALTVGAVAVLVDRGGDDPVADENSEPSPTTVRLFELVPISAQGAMYMTWIDIAAARPVLDADGPEVDLSTAWPSGGTDGAAAWWRQLGIDHAGTDGWLRWDEPSHSQLVAIGPFDADAIDAAIRNNDWAVHLTSGDHRGVATYAWGEESEVYAEEMVAGTFPGLSSLRVAVIDDVLLIAHATEDLHQMIDHVLDDSPSMFDELVTLDVLRTFGDDARLGGQFWGPTSDWDNGHIDLFGPGDDPTLGRHAPPMVILIGHERSADAEAARLQPRLDRLVGEQTADWADDLQVSAVARDGAVLIATGGLDDMDTGSDIAGEVVLFREDVRRTVFPELGPPTSSYPLS